MLQNAYGLEEGSSKSVNAEALSGSVKPAARQPSSAVRAARKVLDPQEQAGVIDSVVAVVNDDVITRYELDERVQMVVRQLQKQKTPLPASDVLERQILERMITDMLLAQYAIF